LPLPAEDRRRVGANYRATCRCRSDNDFIAKLGIAIEEADESAFWLEVLAEAQVVNAAAVRPLLKEAETARRNRRFRREANRPNANHEP